MLAAVNAVPPLMTLGNATPARPRTPSSRAARDASTGIRDGGVHGRGVGAEMISPMTLPRSTSTRPALTEDPPTSMPSTSVVMGAPPELSPSQIRRCGELQFALPPPLAVAHPYRGERDTGRHDEYHDGGEGVDVRRHTEAHLRENDHGQRARPGSGDELRDDQIIPRKRERQQPPGSDRRQDERQRDAPEHRQGPRPEVHGRLLQRFVEPGEAR